MKKTKKAKKPKTMEIGSMMNMGKMPKGSMKNAKGKRTKKG